MLRRNYQTLREATINLNNSLKDNDGRPLDRATNGAKDPDKAIESKGSGACGEAGVRNGISGRGRKGMVQKKWVRRA